MSDPVFLVVEADSTDDVLRKFAAIRAATIRELGGCCTGYCSTCGSPHISQNEGKRVCRVPGCGGLVEYKEEIVQ